MIVVSFLVHNEFHSGSMLYVLHRYLEWEFLWLSCYSFLIVNFVLTGVYWTTCNIYWAVNISGIFTFDFVSLLHILWNWSSAIEYFVDQNIFPDTVDNKFSSSLFMGGFNEQFFFSQGTSIESSSDTYK